MIPPDAVWLITGTSTGLGRAFATHIATHPTYRLAATARDVSSLTSLPASPRTLTLPLDVTSPPSIAAAISATLSRFGRIDVLVNNAGINSFAPAELLSEERAREIMEVNFWGVVRCSRAVVGVMRRQGRGVVVQVGSVGGRVAVPAHAAYHASKFAVEGWSEGLMRELDPGWGVMVCVLEPGGVRSGFLEKSRQGVYGVFGGEEEGVGEGEGKGQGEAVRAYRECGPVKAMMEGLMSEELEEGMADPAEMVKTAVGVLERNDGELPFRLPLGADAVAAIEALERERREEFEKWKGVGVRVGTAGAEIPLGKKSTVQGR